MMIGSEIEKQEANKNRRDIEEKVIKIKVVLHI